MRQAAELMFGRLRLRRHPRFLVYGFLNISGSFATLAAIRRLVLYEQLCR